MQSNPHWDEMVLVGRVARPHGLRGDVVVAPETDFVDERFRVGATVWARFEGRDEELTVSSLRMQGGRPVVRFDGFSRVEDAERLAGAELRVAETALRPLAPGTFYHYELVGCIVETLDGRNVGVVERVDGGAGGTRLVVAGARGEILVPFAEEICRDIDVGARRIRIDPPEGLLELNATDR